MGKSLLDRTTLALFKTVPARAAHHLLFLAQSRPDSPIAGAITFVPSITTSRCRTFARSRPSRSTVAARIAGIDFRWDQQLALLDALEQYRSELPNLDFDFHNAFFSGFDAVVYYSLIRHLQPNRVIEIGGGYSTRIAAQAMARNAKGRLTCIEPYPEARLLDGSLNLELIQKRVEEINVDFFNCLDANDILFIDSSHTVKFGSDVCYEFLELLPRLRPGVWIHVHDIFFPHDYPAEWLLDRRLALNEQYLLEAFLSFNQRFAPQLTNYWICLDRADVAARLWSNDANTRASSFWMKRVA